MQVKIAKNDSPESIGKNWSLQAVFFLKSDEDLKNQYVRLYNFLVITQYIISANTSALLWLGRQRLELQSSCGVLFCRFCAQIK